MAHQASREPEPATYTSHACSTLVSGDQPVAN
jgi:hypothetical protein